jgi:ABC-type multidrug transport system fused ATPase/permease subunit
VSQDPTMFAGTVAENIAYARPHASRAEVEAAAAAANAHGWVSFYLSFYLFSYGQLD